MSKKTENSFATHL